MKRERSRKYRALERLRMASQAVFFGLFVYLFIGAHYTGQDYIGSTVQRFFHFDPLLALVTIVSARLVYAWFAFALVTAVATILFGRIFCGWVCPLGAVNQLSSFLFKKAKFLRPPREDKASLAPKYYILVLVLVGALLGLDLAGYLDPLSFLTRSFALAVLPSLAQALSGLGGILYGLGAAGLARSVSQLLQNWTINTTFIQGFSVGLFFLAAVGLNARRERFWCRYLCPTGALLGLLSRWNLVKLRIDDEACIKCGLCTQHCETQAHPYPNDGWKSGECVYCLNCASRCPTAAIHFPLSARFEKAANVSNVDLSRRKLLLTTIAGLAAAPFFRLTPSRKRASVKLLRPPGSLPEDKFLAKCVKCGQCMRACPTGGLQPVLAEAGPEGIYTPRLVPKIGYCEYYCSLCTQVCPTGAIRKLTIEEKNRVKMGTAWLNKSRCIPHVLGKPCVVCEEHCPVSPKAIKLVEVQTRLPDGTIAAQKAPFIDHELCIGCGICENKCPVADEPAIFVTSVGETRSETNRLLLDISGGSAEDPYK
ncbi:MAG TPA: 4Fe-4S binding protein [Candidatus Aminicenantes bacterium]|nr:4Fe-4S binding protein [Candidatus Aminicenantes bacterium]HRY64141.1 4Fe-4S binding protein [Candidatus Aminicenantes bacterium]HRZ71054.1 4Fe-4S binding protein [Candidatus Aminicenantes bacterium]